MPFSSSLPAAWKRPPPSALIALDWNTARGNFALLNQGERGNSTSLSAKPTVALAVSTMIDDRAALRCFRIERELGVEPRKRPSIGTPLCLTWNVISLCAGTSFAVGAGCAPAAVASRSGARALADSAAARHARLRLGHHGHMRASRPSRAR